MLKRLGRAAGRAVRKAVAAVAVAATLMVPIAASAAAMTFLSAGPVMAQDNVGSGGVSLITTILIAGAAALVPLLINGWGNIWTWFVANSAKSEATWDNWTVARVREAAREVLKEEQSGKSPIPPPAPPPAT